MQLRRRLRLLLLVGLRVLRLLLRFRNQYMYVRHRSTDNLRSSQRLELLIAGPPGGGIPGPRRIPPAAVAAAAAAITLARAEQAQMSQHWASPPLHPQTQIHQERLQPTAEPELTPATGP
ncbi:hypothetical protein C8J57DRAFT_1470786 [Mycena rebaudengoi]|nr:hypothetical protein C8J57DRAFT_1470786 [Mycena rebaudengoi]